VSTIHHSAICTTDIEGSLTFWRDGLGFDVLMDHKFVGDWATLFGARTNRLRSVFLGEADGDQAMVELVEFLDDEEGGVPTTAELPDCGFMLLSMYADLDEVLPRCAGLGVGGEPRVVTVDGVRLAVIADPNGVMVELMDSPARAGIEHVTS